jgi:hypothetical protein
METRNKEAKASGPAEHYLRDNSAGKRSLLHVLREWKQIPNPELDEAVKLLYWYKLNFADRYWRLAAWLRKRYRRE